MQEADMSRVMGGMSLLKCLCLADRKETKRDVLRHGGEGEVAVEEQLLMF